MRVVLAFEVLGIIFGCWEVFWNAECSPELMGRKSLFFFFHLKVNSFIFYFLQYFDFFFQQCFKITAEAYISNPNTPEVPLGSPKKLVELENVTVKQFKGDDGKEKSFVLLPFESKFINFLFHKSFVNIGNSFTVYACCFFSFISLL